MPPIVYLLLENLAIISGFEIIPPDDIIAEIFTEGFTETEPVNQGWVEMKNESKVAIEILGSVFLIMIMTALNLMLYGLLYFFEPCGGFFRYVRWKIGGELFYSGLLLVGTEGYLDFGLGGLANVEEPYINTFDDCLNMMVVGFILTVIVLLPILNLAILCSGQDNMGEIQFDQKFGALYDGFKTNSYRDKRSATIMSIWFLIRRLLFAALIIWGREYFLWVQLSCNLVLILVDKIFKLHYSPYKSKLGGFLEKNNDLYVLFCSYLLFCFTDYSLTVDNKQLAGWMFVIAVCLMTVVNIFTLLVYSIINLVKDYGKKQIQRRHKKAIEQRQKRAIRQRKFRSRTQQQAIEIKEEEDDKFEQIQEVAKDWLNGKFKADQMEKEKVQILRTNYEQAQKYFGPQFGVVSTRPGASNVQLQGHLTKTKRKLVLRKIGVVNQTSVRKLKSVSPRSTPKDQPRKVESLLLPSIEERLESISEESERESGWWIKQQNSRRRDFSYPPAGQGFVQNHR